MKNTSLWNYLPSAGSLLSVLLIGMVLLSGLVYYRAVKIQRFLEPALAVSQPRNEFSKRISGLFQSEFGRRPVRGIEFRMGSIRLNQSLLFTAEGGIKAQGQIVLAKLARILATLMRDEQARPEISLILISARVPRGANPGAVVADRLKAQFVTAFVQDSMFRAEPDLGARYASSFATVTRITDDEEGNADIDIRIIPSEFLHIRVLERLEKYSY